MPRKSSFAPVLVLIVVLIFLAFLSGGRAVAVDLHLIDRGDGTVAAVPATEFSTLSIFASNNIWLQKDSELVSGNAVVNEASPGPTLNSDVEFSAARGVLTHQSPLDQGMLKADSFSISAGVVIGSDSQDVIAYNELSNGGTINATQVTPLSLPVIPPSALPPFESGTPGTDDVVVGKDESVSLPPGSYHDILVQNGGVVLFQAAGTTSVFDVRSIDGGNDVQLRFEDSTEVHVADKFNVGKGSFVGPDSPPTAADDIIFYVAGVNGSGGGLSATPEAVQVGQSSVVESNFYAPNGTIFLQAETDATGGFFARDVRVGVRAQVLYDSFFGQ